MCFSSGIANVVEKCFWNVIQSRSVNVKNVAVTLIENSNDSKKKRPLDVIK